jgi:transcriptional regulator with XRE-family HTH domain
LKHTIISAAPIYGLALFIDVVYLSDVVGTLLRAARDRVGKSQAEVAAELGVTQPTVSAWEADDALPKSSRWQDIAIAYQIELDALTRAVLGVEAAA